MSSLNSFSFLLSFFVLLAGMAFLQVFRNCGAAASLCCKVQLMALLVFSYAFLCRADIRFGACVAVETLIAYGTGRLLDKSSERTKIKLMFGMGGVTLIVLILGYFKYCNFFLDNFSNLIGKNICLDVILPIGISFYSFTAISYMIDVYRGTYNAENSFINVALLIAFFPKITAGPIIRGGCFLPQIREYEGIRLSNCRDGIQIFVFGLFKKIVLADRLGVFVDDVFFSPFSYHTFTVALAVLSYAMQIYFDFSGYSDMAIGLSKILGFQFPRNFNLPYLSKNLSEFWKRWHISLSSWLQDYVYIPLGGSRKGIRRSYVNLMLVMLVSGLWHGAGWNFILWGFFHGIGSCVNKWMVKQRGGKKESGKIEVIVNVLITFVVVALLWVVFRAESLSKAMDVYGALFTYHDGIVQPYAWTFFAVTVLAFSTLIACFRQKGAERIDGFYPVMDLNSIRTLTVFFVFMGLTVMLGYFGNTVFIYERF